MTVNDRTLFIHTFTPSCQSTCWFVFGKLENPEKTRTYIQKLHIDISTRSGSYYQAWCCKIVNQLTAPTGRKPLLAC